MGTVRLSPVPFQVGGFPVELEGVVFTAPNLTNDEVNKACQGVLYDTLGKITEGTETVPGLRNRLAEGGSAVILPGGLFMIKDKIKVKRV